MDSFRTELNIPPASFRLHHKTGILCIGSCFAEEIGSRLQRLKFPCFVNPSGIIFNPVSIAHSLQNLIDQRQYAQSDLFHHDGLWHSFNHHGSFSDAHPENVLNSINKAINDGAAFLRSAKVLMLTLGTAHVFRHKTDGRIVANCHKLPGQQFERQRLEVSEIESSLCKVLKKLEDLNPGLQLILTVSPVRHLRDGLHENNLSKASLLLAVEHLQRAFSNVHYFPAYELLIDDLRDYRFYSTDLSHPNELALDYIWKKFRQTYFQPTTAHLCDEIESLKRAMDHRPIHPSSEKHRQFLRQMAENCRSLAERHPELDFSEELVFFEKG